MFSIFVVVRIDKNVIIVDAQKINILTLLLEICCSCENMHLKITQALKKFCSLKIWASIAFQLFRTQAVGKKTRFTIY